MAPIPFGPATKHILASNGPCCNKAQFYVTEYSSNHGKEDFVPQVGKSQGTGYKSNFRPGLYYNQKIDELDNPKVGKLMTENYNSISKLHFQRYKGSNGRDIFPTDIPMVKTGFVRDIPRTMPSYHTVKSVCFNPSYENSKKTKSFLYRYRTKDPVEQENDHQGPGLMSTENKTRYGEPCPLQTDRMKSVKKNEDDGSGFTHANNVEPITYRPDECFDNSYSTRSKQRPTGSSIMKESFQQVDNAVGTESFKLLSKRAGRDTGYTRKNMPRPVYAAPVEEVYTKLDDLHPRNRAKIKKNDPAEYTNLVYAKPFPSTTISTFQGLQRNSFNGQSVAECSNKCETGFTENNCRFVEANKKPGRFVTNYNVRFVDKNLQKNDGLKSHVLEQLSNGFTKSTRVHDEDKCHNLYALHPYVARSILSRDPFYSK